MSGIDATRATKLAATLRVAAYSVTLVIETALFFLSWLFESDFCPTLTAVQTDEPTLAIMLLTRNVSRDLLE